VAYFLSVQGAVNVSGHIDILMITYNRPEYTRLSLTRLLETCNQTMRVWLWHNGDHGETADVVKSVAQHPSVHEFHHSKENRKLREPTNWLWQNAKGDYLSKVDDDCLLPDGWAQQLRGAHEDGSQFGVLGCWRFQDEDFEPRLAERKIRELAGGHRVMTNCWVEGSGYLMKRRCVQQAGLLRPGETFTQYCVRLASAGWINGWYYPFIRQEHMDDPRALHSLIKSDADLQHHLPLSAINSGVKTVEQWTAQLRRSARIVQSASPNPRVHTGWRRKLRTAGMKVRRALGGGRYLG
jgi:glycosyltransferase involved in cell wall biosynthesis